MGQEYKVKFKYQGPQLDSLLRTLPFFVAFDEERQVYCYRTEGNTGTMPSVEISVETDGVYLCDYGMFAQFFGIIIVRFVSHFGSVQIEDFAS